MPRAALQLENLALRRKVWFVRIRVPEDVKPAIGQSVLVRTTGQRDPKLALSLAQPIIAEFKARIARARVGLPLDPEEPIRVRGLSRLAREKAAQPAPKPLTPFLAHAEAWARREEERGIKPRQLDQSKRDVALYGANRLLKDATTATAQEWVFDRLKGGDSKKTVQRRLSPLRSYWGFLMDQGVLPDGSSDPFRALRMPKASKAGPKPGRRDSFTKTEIAALWAKAGENNDQPLQALIALGAYTGARLEELCSLTKDTVDLGAWTIQLDSKTEAGRRTVPIHEAIKPLVCDLAAKAQAGRWLVHSNCTNQYGERGVLLGKRFGRMKTDMGHGRDKVFHSLRKSVATLLQDAGCPEPIAADILGHELETMSYGVYSTGSSVGTRREWLEKAVNIEEVRYRA